MIRKVTSADRALFLALEAEFYHSDAVLHPVPPEYHERTFDELMRSDEYAAAFILESGGEAAGYGLLSRTFSAEAGGMVVWLEELYLRPAFRGQGLGSEFFRTVEKAYPAARCRLEVEPDNVRAAALYRRLGYGDLPYRQMMKQCTAEEK